MRYAGFWRRAAGYSIDFVLLNLLSWGIELAFTALVYGARKAMGDAGDLRFDDTFSPVVTQVIGAVVYLALSGSYSIHGHHRYGTTLGKRAVRVYVVRVGTGESLGLGRSALRFLAYLPSYLPLGCGFLMAAFHPQKRALHDLIAGTVSVIKER